MAGYKFGKLMSKLKKPKVKGVKMVKAKKYG